MNGRIVAGGIAAIALAAGAAMWWLQEYAFYHVIPAESPEARVRLVAVATGRPEVVQVEDLRAIDANSSPLRFRACFHIDTGLAELARTFAAAEHPVPLNGPRWFTCYDAGAIGAALESGEARAFVAEPEIHPGVERLVAVFPDGRAFAWQQLRPGRRD